MFLGMAYPVFMLSHALIVYDHFQEYVINEPSTVVAPPTSTILIHAALQPWSNKSAGDVTVRAIYFGGDGSQYQRPFFPPSNYLRDHRPGRYVLRTALVPVMFWLLLPMCMFIVTHAQVSWTHLVRISFYAVPLLALAADWVFMRSAAERLHTLPGALMFSEGFRGVELCLIPFLLWAWWAIATTRYLRINAGWIAVAVCGAITYIIALIGAEVVAVILS